MGRVDATSGRTSRSGKSAAAASKAEAPGHPDRSTRSNRVQEVLEQAVFEDRHRDDEARPLARFEVVSLRLEAEMTEPVAGVLEAPRIIETSINLHNIVPAPPRGREGREPVRSGDGFAGRRPADAGRTPLRKPHIDDGATREHVPWRRDRTTQRPGRTERGAIAKVISSNQINSAGWEIAGRRNGGESAGA